MSVIFLVFYFLFKGVCGAFYGLATERQETTSTRQPVFWEFRAETSKFMQLPKETTTTTTITTTTRTTTTTTTEVTTFAKVEETVNASMKNTLGPIDKSKFDPIVQRCGFVEFVLFISLMVNMLLTCLALILTIVGKRKVYKYILREREDMKEM